MLAYSSVLYLLRFGKVDRLTIGYLSKFGQFHGKQSLPSSHRGTDAALATGDFDGVGIRQRWFWLTTEGCSYVVAHPSARTIILRYRWVHGPTHSPSCWKYGRLVQAHGESCNRRTTGQNLILPLRPSRTQSAYVDLGDVSTIRDLLWWSVVEIE